MKNKSTCSPIFSEEQKQKIAILEGFQKQNTHTTGAEYAKANNVKKGTLCRWAEVYGIPLGFHHTKAFSEEERIALLEGFQKQKTHTTIAKYEKANNVKKGVLGSWSRSYGIPLGFHHTKVLPKEERIALLDGFQKQSTHTTIAKYEKANNVKKNVLGSWSRRYGIPLGWHHTNHKKPLPKEQKLALLEGFQKQNTYTTIAKYEKANNVKKGVLGSWSRSYGIPLGFHHTKVFSEEQKLALLEGFQKQNTYTTIESYAKANNVREGALFSWAVLCGMPLGWHHRKVLPKEQKIALLEGFQKQNTHTTVSKYAKANNVSIPALFKWATLYGIPLGWHHTKRIQKTPQGSHSEISAA
jgi:hypothetical protein